MSVLSKTVAEKTLKPLLIVQIEVADTGDIERLEDFIGLTLVVLHSMGAEHREVEAVAHLLRHWQLLLLSWSHWLLRKHKS